MKFQAHDRVFPGDQDITLYVLTFLHPFDVASFLITALEYGALRLFRMVFYECDHVFESELKSLSAVNGCWKTFKQLFHHDPSRISKRILENSIAKQSNIQILPWLMLDNKKKIFKTHFFSIAYTFAAEKQDLEMIQSLYQYSQVIPSEAIIIAAKNGNLEIVQWLLDHCEKTWMNWSSLATIYVLLPLRRKDQQYINWNVGTKQGTYFQYFVTRHGLAPVKARSKHNAIYKAMDWAAEIGDLDLLKLLNDDPEQRALCSSAAMINAAINGCLGILKWLHTNFHFDWKTATVVNAASTSGKSQVIKWIYEVPKARECSCYAIESFILKGNFEMAQWIQEHFQIIETSGFTIEAINTAASKENSLPIIKWLHDKYRAKWNSVALVNAIRRQDLELLEWLHANGNLGFIPRVLPLISLDVWQAAAEVGNEEILQWLFEWNTLQDQLTKIHIFNTIVASGQLEIVKWVWDHFSITTATTTTAATTTQNITDGNTVYLAAWNNRLETCQWLLQKDQRTKFATRGRELLRSPHHKSNKWLVEYFRLFLQYRPDLTRINEKTMIDCCIEIGDWDLLKLLEDQIEIDPMDDEVILDRILRKYTQGDIVLWFCRRKHELFSSNVVRWAAKYGFVQFFQTIFKFIEIEESQWYVLVKEACLHGHLSLLKWVYERHQVFFECENTNIIDWKSKRSLVEVAVRHGHVDVLEWLLRNLHLGNNRSLVSSRTCNIAVVYNKIGILQSLSWHFSTVKCSYYAWKYAVKNDLDTVLIFLIQNDHKPMQLWLKKKKFRWLLKQMVRIAAKHENIKLLSLLKARGLFVDEQHIDLVGCLVKAAAAHGSVNVLEWFDHEFPAENRLKYELGIRHASEKGLQHTVQWLVEHHPNLMASESIKEMTHWTLQVGEWKNSKRYGKLHFVPQIAHKVAQLLLLQENVPLNSLKQHIEIIQEIKSRSSSYVEALVMQSLLEKKEENASCLCWYLATRLKIEILAYTRYEFPSEKASLYAKRLLASRISLKSLSKPLVIPPKWASKYGDGIVLEYLLNCGGKNTAGILKKQVFRAAIEANQVEILAWLLKLSVRPFVVYPFVAEWFSHHTPEQLISLVQWDRINSIQFQRIVLKMSIRHGILTILQRTDFLRLRGRLSDRELDQLVRAAVRFDQLSVLEFFVSETYLIAQKDHTIAITMEEAKKYKRQSILKWCQAQIQLSQTRYKP